jgi:hypothetical protein
LGVEIPLPFEIKIRLHRRARNDDSKLRPDAHSARFERAQFRYATAVRRELIVDIADHANHQGLGQKLRCAPVEMPIDTVPIIGARIDEIVGKAGHRGEFVPGFFIEIGVTETGVDGAVTDAELGKVG